MRRFNIPVTNFAAADDMDTNSWQNLKVIEAPQTRHLSRYDSLRFLKAERLYIASESILIGINTLVYLLMRCKVDVCDIKMFPIVPNDRVF